MESTFQNLCTKHAETHVPKTFTQLLTTIKSHALRLGITSYSDHTYTLREHTNALACDFDYAQCIAIIIRHLDTLGLSVLSHSDNT